MYDEWGDLRRMRRPLVDDNRLPEQTLLRVYASIQTTASRLLAWHTRDTISASTENKEPHKVLSAARPSSQARCQRKRFNWIGESKPASVAICSRSRALSGKSLARMCAIRSSRASDDNVAHRDPSHAQ